MDNLIVLVKLNLTAEDVARRSQDKLLEDYSSVVYLNGNSVNVKVRVILRQNDLDVATVFHGQGPIHQTVQTANS